MKYIHKYCNRYLQEDVDDGSIPKEVHDPKEKEGNANDMDNQWMLWRKLSPVRMDKLENILRDAIEMGGALGVDQVVLGVHVDAMLRLPSRHLRHGKWPYQLVSNLFFFGHHPQKERADRLRKRSGGVNVLYLFLGFPSH